MKLRNLILAVASFGLLAVSCQKEKPVLGVEINPTVLSFSADGGTLTVQAKSSDNWTLSVPSAAQQWLTVSPLTGSGDVTVSFTASENAGKPRSITVNFTSGMFTESLAISQEGKLKAGDGKTLETAFTASEANAWVFQNLGSGDISPERYFVKGKIHKMVTSGGVEQYFSSNTYGNASFFISDDGQASDEDFECFQVNYLGNRAWKNGDTDVAVGDDVVIYGFLTNYNGNTAETTGKGAAYLVVLNDNKVEPVIESKAEPKGSGTAEDPYNVAAAINAAAPLGYTNTSTYEKIQGVFVRGVISAIKNIDTTTQYGNAEYTIVDEGFTAPFGVYRGYFLGNEKFTSADQIKVGDKVVITGDICNMFGNTPQFTNGNYIVELNGEKPKEPDTVTGSVTDCFSTEDNNIVVVKDAIVAALSAKGFIVTDGKSNCYVYQNEEPAVKIGDKVELKAVKTTYYDLPEFKDVESVTVISSGNEVPRTELLDVTAGIDSYNSAVADYVSVTGTLTADGDYYNVEVPGASRKAQASQPHASVALAGLVGKRVTMTGYFNTIHQGRNLLQMVVTEVAEASADQKYCYANPQEINVKASDTSASFTITSNTLWVIDNIDNGIVVSPNEGSGDATVNISIPVNEGQEGRSYSMRVFSEKAGVELTVTVNQEGQADALNHTVSAIIQNKEDIDEVEVYGAVVAALTTKGFVLTDGTSNIYVYQNAIPTVQIGDMVDVTSGYDADYYGLPELTNVKSISVTSSGNSVPYTSQVTLDASNIDSYSSGMADYLAVEGKLEKSGSYWKVIPEGATRYASPDYMISSIDPSALEGQQVRLIGYFNTIHTKNNYVKVITTEIVPADDGVKYCTVSPAEITVESEVESAVFSISSNAAWTLECDNSDFTLSRTSGDGNANVTVTFSKNETGAPRVAIVTVSCPGASVTAKVTVTQKKAVSADAKSITLTFPDENSSSNKVGAYTKEWTAIIGSNSWTISNFNNNNWNNWTYIKCGRKDNASVASIALDQAVPFAVSSVTVTVDKVLDASKVNSAKLIVASDAAFSSVVAEVSLGQLAAGNLEYNISQPAANLYYKLEYDCAGHSSNGIIQISKIVYVGE